MRYLVRARVKPGLEPALLEAIDRGTLGEGSVAEGEYLRNMSDARLASDDTARWVEVCYCPTPLLEERPYWEQYFDLVKVQDAHDRRKCRDQNGSEPRGLRGLRLHRTPGEKAEGHRQVIPDRLARIEQSLVARSISNCQLRNLGQIGHW